MASFLHFCGKFFYMKKSYLYFILLFALTSVVSAQTVGTFKSYLKEPVTTREHPVDMLRTIIDVKFDCPKGEVIGKVTHEFRPLLKTVDSMFLDGPGIEIGEVKMAGNAVTFKKSEKGNTFYFNPALQWDKEYTMQISYTAKPSRGIYFIGWNDETTDQHKREWGYVRKQIWTQGQGVDNRYWIPCYDEGNDKTITETIITFDRKYQVLSNGVLQSKKENKDNTITWHYKMSHPHATYLVMLGIGEFAVKQGKSSKGTPVNFWYYSDFANRVNATSCYTEQMVDFMEEELMTSYPWESYSQVMVQDFLYGAMENTTATIFGDFFFVDGKSFNDRNYINVNMHEFTHQWFGDYITARNVAHQWLQESFATHYPKYFERKLYGEDHFQWLRYKEMQAALDAAKKESIPVAHTGGSSAIIYQKGSEVLDMLRYVLGNDEYRKVIAHYLKKHAYNNVETYDLQVAIHEVLGRNLDWFFDQWVHRSGEPHYEISWMNGKDVNGGQATNIIVKQIQSVSEVISYFKMPVMIRVYYFDGSYDEKKVWVEGPQTDITIQNERGKVVSCVVFDVGNNILKQVTYKRSFGELKSQITFCDNMIDRYEALLALKSESWEKKKELLEQVIAQESFHLLRSEAWIQLLNDAKGQTRENYMKALNDRHIEVRKAVIVNTAVIPAGMGDLFAEHISDSSYVLQENLLEKLYIYYPSDLKNWINKSIDSGLGNSILIKRFELLYRSGDKSQLSILINMASSHYEFRTRINAFNALKAMNYCDEQVIIHLYSAAMSWNGRLGGPAKETLEYFAQQKAYKQMMSDVYKKMSDADKKTLKEKGVSY